jgi:8-oxo-dGTP diphosphatase
MQAILAVSAVLIQNSRVLFVRRANPPGAGLLALPGGKIEAGETLKEGVARELLEETGIHARPVRLLTAVDVFKRDAAGKLRSHYVIITFLCEWLCGREKAGSDATELVWMDLETMEKERRQITPSALDVAKLALTE